MSVNPILTTANNNTNMERPGPRDILFPTLSTDVHIFTHDGNRSFFTFLSLFLEDYARNPQALQVVAHQALDLLLAEGYRFLKLAPDGVFHELTNEECLERVKGCLQSQAPNLATHIQKYNIRKCAQLLKENINTVKYAEDVTAAAVGTVETDDYWVRPRGYLTDADVIANAVTTQQEQNLTNASSANNSKFDKTGKTVPKKKTTIAKPPKRNIKSLDAIVIASMQQGVLPIGGNWKFFPLPELQNKVNLGAESNGWQLRLEPISMPGDPVVLDVPFT